MFFYKMKMANKDARYWRVKKFPQNLMPNGRGGLSCPKKIHLVADEFICRPNNKEARRKHQILPLDRRTNERTLVRALLR